MREISSTELARNLKQVLNIVEFNMAAEKICGFLPIGEAKGKKYECKDGYVFFSFAVNKPGIFYF